MNIKDKSLDEIIEKYERYLNDNKNEDSIFKYIWAHQRFNSIFALSLKELMLEEKSALLKKTNNNQSIENTKRVKEINSIFCEIYEVKKEVEENYIFYDKVLGKLLIDNEKYNASDIYMRICESIIVARKKYDINKEKLLLILNEKLRQFF